LYQLYYYPLNASMAPHFVLEEMGVDYELNLVDRKSNAQKSRKYLELNPVGRIPTLVDDGLVVFESAAICLHLCDKNQESKLIPSIGDSDRALFYQWLMYLNNTVQAELMVYFYPSKHTTNSESVSAIVEAQESRVTDMFKLLDRELEYKEFLVGNRITVCDYFLFMLALWADEFKQPPLSFVNLSRYLRKLAKRPAVIKVCKKEHFSLADYE
jgi:glutathione S-transferase